MLDDIVKMGFKMRLICVFLLPLLLVGCGPRSYFGSPETKFIAHIIHENNRKLVRIGLYEYGFGGGGQPLTKTISECYVTNRYRFSSVEEARPFICYVFEEFAKPLNAEAKIQPFVQDFPLTAENIEISIAFVDNAGKVLESPFISDIDTREGKIMYYRQDETGHWQLIHSEPYEEAKRICLQNGTLMPE